MFNSVVRSVSKDYYGLFMFKTGEKGYVKGRERQGQALEEAIRSKSVNPYKSMTESYDLPSFLAKL